MVFGSIVVPDYHAPPESIPLCPKLQGHFGLHNYIQTVSTFWDKVEASLLIAPDPESPSIAIAPRRRNSGGAPWLPSLTPRGGLGPPTRQERPSPASSPPPTTPSRSGSNPQRRGQATESELHPRAANIREVKNTHVYIGPKNQYFGARGT